MKVKFFILLILFMLLTSPTQGTSRLEPTLLETQKKLSELDQSLSLSDRRLVKDTSPSQKYVLSPSLRKIFAQRNLLKEQISDLQQVLNLKKDLIALSRFSSSEEEAELIAIKTVQTFKKLKNDFRMLRPAGLQNIFINLGLKKEGFCWHWARDLLSELEILPLKTFQLQWITAREGTLREHNAVAVLPFLGRKPEEEDLQKGIVIDGWRKSGKPFWIKVGKDSYPWKIGEFQQN